jgi:hypothetical protein
MDKYEKKAFLAEYSALQKSLDPSPLVAEMVSAGLVTENQLEDITETATDSAKNVKLLEIVRKHGNSRVFELFMKCIEDADEAQKYLADRLRDALQNARLPLAQQESCGRDEDSGQPQGQPRNEQQEPNFEDLKGVCVCPCARSLSCLFTVHVYQLLFVFVYVCVGRQTISNPTAGLRGEESHKQSGSSVFLSPHWTYG